MLALNHLRAELVSPEDAESIRSEWTELAARVIEPNPYYEIDYLTALFRNILASEEHWLILVRDRTSNRLDGLFPVTVKGTADGFPGGATVLSFDSLIGQTVPLVAGDDPAAVWAAFVDFAADSSELPPIICLPEFYPDSLCGRALSRAVESQQALYRAESRFLRAIATNHMAYHDYTQRWSRKKARNIRSRFRKLSELGPVDLEIVRPGGERFGETLAEILALEVMGWKGRSDTALASKQNTHEFARAAFASAHNAPTIHLATLRLDGKLIAGDINLIAQRRAYFIKSAYDETYSKLGPGVILYDFALQEMLSNGGYERLDSCADAGHALEEIWLERETVERAFVAAPAPANGRAIDRMIAARAALFAMRNAGRRVKRLLAGTG